MSTLIKTDVAIQALGLHAGRIAQRMRKQMAATIKRDMEHELSELLAAHSDIVPVILVGIVAEFVKVAVSLIYEKTVDEFETSLDTLLDKAQDNFLRLRLPQSSTIRESKKRKAYPRPPAPPDKYETDIKVSDVVNLPHDSV